MEGARTGAKTTEYRDEGVYAGWGAKTRFQAIGAGALTSLNSWIWACSNMENTLEEPRWACLVAAALPRVPAFLLACNTVGGKRSSPRLPKDSPLPMRTPGAFPGEPRSGSSSCLWRLPLQAQCKDRSHWLSSPIPRDSTWEPAGLRLPHPALTIFSLWQLGCCKGPPSPFMLPLSPGKPNKDRKRRQAQTWQPCLGWGRTGPQADSSHVPGDLQAP